MEKDVAVMDLALSRLFFNFVAASIMVCCYRQHVIKNVGAQFKSPLIYRSFMLLIGQIMNVYAISLLPLGLLTIIQNTQAFWTAILAYFINKETFYKVEGIGIVACFLGVLMIALSGKKHEDDADVSRFEDPEVEKEHEVELFGGTESAMRIVGIVTMIFVAANDASINVLARTMKELHFSLLCFWFSAIGCAFLVIYLVIACII